MEEITFLHLHFYCVAGVIDYNFHCFRTAIERVFELRNQITSTSNGANMLMDMTPGQNGIATKPADDDTLDDS